MNLLNDNLEYLKIYNPDTYQAIRKFINKNNKYELVKTKDELYNIKVKKENLFLYSQYSPINETNRWAKMLDLHQNNNHIILFGLGLSYHLSSLIEQFPNRKIIIFEPDPELFVKCLEIIDIRLIISHSNIEQLIVGNNSLAIERFVKIFRIACTLEYNYVRLPFIDKLQVSIERTFLSRLKDSDLSRKSINGMHNNFGNLMHTNTLRNITKLNKMPTLKVLKDRFKGVTAVVVGAGPSLQDNIEYLKKNQKNLLIIAAGSSIQNLLHYGLNPHLMVSMDPGVYNAEIFRHNAYEDIPLLVFPQIHYEILDYHKKNNMYAIYPNDPIYNYFVSRSEEDCVFQPTYSVTGSAIQAAIFLGAKQIVLAGQDLSYPTDHLYSPGTKHLTSFVTESLKSELQYEVANVQGSKNLTTFSMLQTLKNIEELIGSYANQIKFINISSKGAAIRGTVYQHSNHITTNEKSIYNFNNITNIISHSIEKNTINIYEIKGRIITLSNELNETKKELHALYNYFFESKKLKSDKLVNFREDMHVVEQQIQKVFNSNLFQNAIQPWILQEIHKLEKQLYAANKMNNTLEIITQYESAIVCFLEEYDKKLPIILSELDLLMKNLEQTKID